MKHPICLLSALAMLVLSACQADVCPPDSITTVPDITAFPPATSEPVGGVQPATELVEIGNKMVEVDRIIHGPVCNDTWSGTVYVTCDIQIAEWSEEVGPFFLDGCELKIAEDTVVFVAAHNNAAYYKGCDACHVSGGAEE